MSEFNSEMLVIARELRTMSQTRLAEEAGMTQSQLSKIENAIIEPDQETLSRLCMALGVPMSFFFQSGRAYGAPMSIHAMFRKSCSIPQKTLSKVTAEMNISLLGLKRLFKSVELESSLPLPRYDIEDTDSTPAEIAGMVRRAWLLREGPIKNLAALVENAGVVVFFSDFSHANIDGVTIKGVPGVPPCIFLNRNRPADRQRFSLAHELGHLVLHSQPNNDMEDQANEFASALLMPEKEFRLSCSGRIDISELARLKLYWKVSMAAALVRAKQVGLLSENQNSYLWRQMSPYRKNEPESTRFKQDEPTVLRDVLFAHLDGLGYSLAELATAMHLNVDDLISLFPVPVGKEKTVPQLRLVPGTHSG